MSDNQCVACGQWAGKGHRCPRPVGITPHPVLAPIKENSNGTEPQVLNRIARAETFLHENTTTVVPCTANFEAFCHVLFAAQSDPALDNVSLPVVETVEDVKRWLDTERWESFVLYEGQTPVGIISLHEPHLTDTPEPYADCRETDLYVLPQWRGKGIVSRGFAALEDSQLYPGERLVAEIWSTNAHSIHWHEKNGWTYEGTFIWEGDGEIGPTKRYVKVIPEKSRTDNGHE